jgi:hypothetical protein
MQPPVDLSACAGTALVVEGCSAAMRPVARQQQLMNFGSFAWHRRVLLYFLGSLRTTAVIVGILFVLLSCSHGRLAHRWT